MNAALSPQIITILSQSAEWRLLGLLFEYPEAAWKTRLSALLPALTPAELRAMGEAALRQSTEGLHIALFGPAGSVPVREAAYQGGVQLGYLMAELSAYYSAFGYETQTGEAPDHLSVELGFLSYLHLKRAHALAQNQTEQAALVEEAAGNFTRNHLAVLAQPVLNRLREFGPGYLVDAGLRLLALAGPAPQSSFPLGDAAAFDDCESMQCGASAANDDFIQLHP
jgi:nitrate reductase assembly molybdenum cofactor insertion protein NarJ